MKIDQPGLLGLTPFVLLFGLAVGSLREPSAPIPKPPKMDITRAPTLYCANDNRAVNVEIQMLSAPRLPEYYNAQIDYYRSGKHLSLRDKFGETAEHLNVGIIPSDDPATVKKIYERALKDANLYCQENRLGEYREAGTENIGPTSRTEPEIPSPDDIYKFLDTHILAPKH